MNNLLKGKKGISPLIAAVMLMALVIAIGAIVMMWSKNYVGDTLTDAESKLESDVHCGQKTLISLVEVSGVKQICYHNSTTGNFTVDYTLQNGPDSALIGMHAEIITTTDVHESEVRVNVPKEKVVMLSNIFGSFSSLDPDTIRTLRLSPIIRYESGEGLQEAVCKGTGIERTLLLDCDELELMY